MEFDDVEALLWSYSFLICDTYDEGRICCSQVGIH